MGSFFSNLSSTTAEDMDIKEDLSQQLLGQTFEDGDKCQAELAVYKQLAKGYAAVENAIAVLSDLKTAKSYVYYGSWSASLALPDQSKFSEIDSIWEEAIFACIHPDDLLNKHLMELQFFGLSRELAVGRQQDFCGINLLRMRSLEGAYLPVKHRIFYISSPANGSLRFALCLYNIADRDYRDGEHKHFILNTITGEQLALNKEKLRAMLSIREREILHDIKKGHTSKEIAARLSISVNTVNRHRQNILEKLNVKNSAAACVVGEKLGIC